ncbi:ATP-binding cassette domain-containing protein [Paenibacillus senegalensis]|uniref:ATP-binding cassette domain-containing protein n=1 Tax=Paenibacillus senegalensis TaxID=1465766 RepID=UPI00028A043A|nr:ABC transporter ATP-binding protein [Paenibacillus senegalensis]
MEADALVNLQQVSKIYGNRVVLSNVSLSVSQGESVVIRGSNGSGKSTLLRIAAGLIPMTKGSRTVKHAQLVIGYTPDRLSKVPVTSVQYLTHMGRIAKVPNKELQQRIRELHALFQLELSPSLEMTHFSKGMLQKVNLMQATLRPPDLLILDEPFSGLDKETAQHLIAFLKQMKAEGTAIVAAVHDSLLARQMESRSCWLLRGELREDLREALPMREAHYELQCYLSPLFAQDLIARFPDLKYRQEENGLVSLTVTQNDYRDILLDIVHEGIEIVNLQRKETGMDA